jgi:hypothetical protein
MGVSWSALAILRGSQQGARSRGGFPTGARGAFSDLRVISAGRAKSPRALNLHTSTEDEGDDHIAAAVGLGLRGAQ